jgi:uncharacterized protein YdaU (DUF1376 family)
MSKQDDFWFKFFPQKWMSGTAFMDYEERGLYITLLCHQHQTGRIPEKTIRFLLGSASVSVWESIKDKFDIDENGCYYNSFLEEQILERLKVNASKAENGKKGGRPKAKEKAKENLMVNLMPNLNGTYSNSISISNSNSNLISLNSSIEGGMGGDYRQDFEWQAKVYNRFLESYGAFGRAPKRGAIEQALLEAIHNLKHLKPEATAQECADFLIAQADVNCKADQANGQTKRLNPETWLNNRVYQTNINLIKQPTKMSPTQRMDAALDKFAAKILGGQNDK